MKTNYILIDYENVQPSKLMVLDDEHFKIVIFIGAHQTKIAIDIAAALHRMGPRAEYVRISGSSANALDFHIAYYVGHLATREPDAYFHIISKDPGFDPLIQHLKSKQLLICRWPNIEAIPRVRITHATSVAERIAVIVANLHQRGEAKPRTVKTLGGSINALFQKTLSEANVAELVREMQRQALITVDDTKVIYALPGQQ